jgi:hypothetical protein
MKSKFNTLLVKAGAEYLLTEEDLRAPVDAPSGLGEVQQNPQGDFGQEEQPPEQDEPEKLTSEGKRFLIEVALKALSINPEQISEQDRSIFAEEVTSHNADEILCRIQTIVDQNT